MTLPLPTVTKKADETRIITFDFSGPANGDPLVSPATMQGAHEGVVPGGITLGEPVMPAPGVSVSQAHLVRVEVSGGVDGTRYELHCVVGTVGSQVLDLGVVLAINDSRN